MNYKYLILAAACVISSQVFAQSSNQIHALITKVSSKQKVTFPTLSPDQMVRQLTSLLEAEKAIRQKAENSTSPEMLEQYIQQLTTIEILIDNIIIDLSRKLGHNEKEFTRLTQHLGDEFAQRFIA